MTEPAPVKAKEEAPPARKTLVLIMKGGGIKGLAYVGALRELEKYYRFNWFVGTSAGAITAVLLAAGYSTDELGEVLGETNFKEFLDAPFYKFPTNLYFYGGIYPGRRIMNWVNDLLVKKLGRSNPGLEEAVLGHINAVNRITIYASRRDQDALEFDSADPKWQDMPASYAVRCSMAIPYVFQPPSYHGSDVFDGGTQNNYPVGVFLRRHPGSEFVGLYLKPEKADSEKAPSKLSQLISIWTESADKRALQDHIANTVVIDPSPIKTLQFGLSAKEKDFLLKAGRAAALEFLHRKQVPGAPSLAELEAAEKEAAVARVNLIARHRRRRIVVRVGLSLSVILSCLFLLFWWSGRAATLLGQLQVDTSGASTASENRNQAVAPAANTRMGPNADATNQPVDKPEQTPVVAPSAERAAAAPAPETQGAQKPVRPREGRNTLTPPPVINTDSVSETVLVSGFVYDAAGVELEGVKITLVGLPNVAPQRTSSNGRFFIDKVPKKKNDPVEIEATKDGYVPKRETYIIGLAIEITLDKKQ